MKTYVIADQLNSKRFTHNTFQRLLYSNWFRIIIALFFILPVLIFNNVFSIYILEKLENPVFEIVKATKVCVIIALFILAYKQYVKRIEKRPAYEFSFKKWYKEFGTGFLIGGGMVTVIVAILFSTGMYQVESTNSPFVLIGSSFRYAFGSFVEDLIFTIILFRLIEEYSGTLIAFITVSITFGLLHFFNDNATLATSLFISLQNITLLAPFILTRRMWMGWAVHFSWNLFQSGIFGLNNSGMDHNGFIQPIISGPDWITGGSFGIEASYVSTVINIIIGLILISIATKKGQIKKYVHRKN